MQAKDVAIWLKALDGDWEVCGADRERGIVPENVVLSANDWGSDQATFDLRRDPKVLWPDISAFTPAVVEIGGRRRWAGRVRETPSKDGLDRVMSVACEGWQYHLDDDVYERIYVHDDLSAWKDTRSLLATNLTRFTTAGKVMGDGAITIGWAAGDTIATNNVVGVTLDLGGPWAKRVIVDWERVNGQADNFLYCVGHPTPDAFSNSQGFFSTPALSGELSSGTYNGDVATPTRYVTIYLIYTGAGGTYGADVMERISRVRVYSDTAYSSGLLAPTVIVDALGSATSLLSADLSQIDPTGSVTFGIPSLAPDEPKTPREMWDGVNAYHNYLAKVDVLARPVFRPLPSRPKYVVGDWSAMEVADATANSGSEIYNRVIVTATTPAGERLRVERSSGQTVAVTHGEITLANPSFDIDTAGWTVSSPSTLARDTTTFDTAPAAAHWSRSGAALADGDFLTTVVAGTFYAGVTYVLTVRMHGANPSPGDVRAFNLTLGSADDYAVQHMRIKILAWESFSVAWTPRSTVTTGVSFKIQATPYLFGATFWDDVFLDSVDVSYSSPTLPSRRGFRHTKVLQVPTNLPSDGIAAAQLGDTWLSGHTSTPFKGTVTLTGDEAVRDRLTGAPVPLEQLLVDTAELLHFSDRVNPDTGGQGRDGRITQVTYNHDENQASVALDNTRADWDALLARLAVVVGG